MKAKLNIETISSEGTYKIGSQWYPCCFPTRICSSISNKAAP